MKFDTLSLFRKNAFAEGISYLVLLLIAMPLKYLADMPMAVTVIGGIHGVLFVNYIVLAILVKEKYKLDFRWMTKVMIASIVPFGTFWMEKRNWNLG